MQCQCCGRSSSYRRCLTSRFPLFFLVPSITASTPFGTDTKRSHIFPNLFMFFFSSSLVSVFLLSVSSQDHFGSVNQGRRDAYHASVIVVMLYMLMSVFIGTTANWVGYKVAAVIRISIRRRIIRIHVRKTVIRTIVPITTKTHRTNHVGIHKVGIASLVPFIFLF